MSEPLNPLKEPERAARLLSYDPHDLSPIEQQERYILEMHSTKVPCPACHVPCNIYEARGEKLPGPVYDFEYTCPTCKVALKHVVPFVMQPGTPGWHWWLRKPITGPNAEKKNGI